MATHPTPMRFDAELARSAEPAAASMSRSVPEQIAHWARIGRELERSPDVSVTQVRKVLDGTASYDSLSPKEQAVARAAWLERALALASALDLEQEFRAARYRYAEADASGHVTIHEPKAAYRKHRRAARR